MKEFRKTLEKYFPTAENDLQFLGQATSKLNQLGFTKENTLPALSVCRDEILSNFRMQVNLTWGDPFMLGGLGGLLVAGKTGLSAFSHHAPNQLGSERFLFIVGPHIAIDQDGKLSSMERKNRSGKSTACGSLMHCLKQFKENNGEYKPQLNLNDIDQYFVENSLAPFQKEIINSDQPEVTISEKALDVILRDFNQLSAEIPEFNQGEIAMIGGIFVHSPNNHHDFFAPKTCYNIYKGTKNILNII